MRTVKLVPSRRGWGAVSAAAALVGPALVVGCGLSGVSPAGNPSPSPAAQAQAASPESSQAGGSGAGTTAAREQTLDLWAADGCLEYLVLDGAGQTVAVSATSLCRVQVSSFSYSALAGPGTFYAYFSRGNGLSDWQAVEGQGDDGFTYWEYSDGQLYRWPSAGGAGQLTVRYSGQVVFEDVSTYLQQNPAGLPFMQSVTEGLEAEAIAREEIGTPLQRNPELPDDDSTEYAQAQDGISARDGQAEQIEQTYQGATQDDVATDQAEVMLLQAQQRENTIIFAPDCTDSDNVESGCGGANAFNDDGGVGEGLDS